MMASKRWVRNFNSLFLWGTLGLFPVAIPSHAEVLSCPPDTKQTGAAPPSGFATACLKADGVRQGPFLTWHENGQQKQSGYYENNKAQGKFTEWYNNATKKSEGQFEAGEMTGVWNIWYPSGQKKIEGFFKSGVKACPWRSWSEDAKEENNDANCATAIKRAVLPSLPVTVSLRKAFVDCGTTQGKVLERILDCVLKNGASATWGVQWKLVTREGEGKEVWQDQATSLLWSSLIVGESNWCRAAGNADPKDASNVCNNDIYQSPTTPTSYCAEDKFSPALISENWKTGIYDASKGGMGAASKVLKIHWRLPTKIEYAQANENGIRSVMPDMGHSSLARTEWTASPVLGLGTEAWVFFGVHGRMYKFIRSSSIGVRCVGR